MLPPNNNSTIYRSTEGYSKTLPEKTYCPEGNLTMPWFADALDLSREFKENSGELLRLFRSGILEFLAGAPEFRHGTLL
jgi:hypothetical protein